MPKYDEDAVEKMIVEQGKIGPRIRPLDIDAQIVSEQYYVFPGTTLTVCALQLRNGYYPVGESACVDPANFSESIGRKIARENARNKIWALEGYLLKSELAGHIMQVKPPIRAELPEAEELPEAKQSTKDI